MRASRFAEPNIARLSRVQTHRKRADSLPASSVQSSSSTRPAQLQAREIQSACGHRGRGHPTRDRDIRASADCRRPRSTFFLSHHRALRPLSKPWPRSPCADAILRETCNAVKLKIQVGGEEITVDHDRHLNPCEASALTAAPTSPHIPDKALATLRATEPPSLPAHQPPRPRVSPPP